MAQQGFPPGRHSRGPHPDDAQYGEEAPYGEAPYRDNPYGDEGQHRGTPHGDENPYRDAPYDDAPYREATYQGAPHGDEISYQGAPYDDVSPPRSDPPAPGHGSRPRSDARPAPGARPDRGVHPERGERHDRSRRADRQRPNRESWQPVDPFASGSDTDADLPPWAAPAAFHGRPTGTLRRPVAPRRPDGTDYRAPDAEIDQDATQAADGPETQTRSGRRRGRAAAARLRKSRRRVYRWCGIAIAACIVVAGVVAILTHHSPKPAPYVTSLQHHEFKSVPNACSSVGTVVLNQFLPGSGRTTTSTLASSTDSACSFTVDSKPNFLVMQVEAQAYQPFAAAGANGSATGNAQDNFVLAQLGLTHPPKKSPLPPAQISNVTGLGQQAFMAFQNEHVTGIETDIVTVVVRERNVVISASLSGQESGHGFGPVPVSTLEAGAKAAAQAILAKVMTQPTA